MTSTDDSAVAAAREIMGEEWQLAAAVRAVTAPPEELAAELALMRAAITRLTDCAHTLQRRIAGI